MTTTDNGGLRHGGDHKVARHDLIPPDFQDALAVHFGRNLVKYPGRNWERGMPWWHCFAAIARHGWKFWRGETYDSASGAHHMICVAWNAMALFCYDTRGIGIDTRGLEERTPQEKPPYAPEEDCSDLAGKKYDAQSGTWVDRGIESIQDFIRFCGRAPAPAWRNAPEEPDDIPTEGAPER